MNETDQTDPVEAARQRKLEHLKDPANALSAQAVERYADLYRRAWGRKGRAAAIKALCLECVGYRRAEVARCTALACPLWEWRPYRAGDSDGGG